MPYRKGNFWYASYTEDKKKKFVTFPPTPVGEQQAIAFELEKKLAKKNAIKESTEIKNEEIEKPVIQNSSDKTLGDLWEKWSKLKSKKKRAWVTDEQNYRNHLLPFFTAEIELSKITRSLCQDFMAHQRTKKKSGNQFSERSGFLAPRSINKHRTLLLGMLNEARAQDWISKVPEFDEEETFDVDRKHLSNADQLQAFINAVEYEAKGDEPNRKKEWNHNKGIKLKKTWVKPFFMTLLYAGLRHSELAQLEWDDIELDSEPKQIKIINDETFKTKTKKNRNVPILKELEPYLVEWRKISGKNKLVFPNHNGKIRPSTDSSFRRAWGNIVKTMGMEGNAVPYMLRHTFATKMLESGLSAPQLMRLMGHKNFETTLKYASHVSEDYEISNITFGKNPK